MGRTEWTEWTDEWTEWIDYLDWIGSNRALTGSFWNEAFSPHHPAPPCPEAT
jgi:hypothetical protein